MGIGLKVGGGGGGGGYTIMQRIFMFMALAYPAHSVSLLALNSFARCSLSYAAIIFSGPIFRNVGVPASCSLLAALTFVCYLGLFPLYFWGEAERAQQFRREEVTLCICFRRNVSD